MVDVPDRCREGKESINASASGIRWWTALSGLFLLVFAVTALSGPGRIDIVDGQTRYEVARSLVEHGDSVIRDKGVWFAVLPGRDGQPHTNYRFPHSALGVLTIWLADATGSTSESRRQFYFTLISPLAGALLALAYALWFRHLGLSIPASLAWAAAGIFCTPNWYYATSTFDDLLAASAGVAAVVAAFLGRERRPMMGAASAGLLLALAFNFKQPLGAFVFPVLAACYRPRLPFQRQLAPLGVAVGGLALGILGQMAYERYKFPPGECNPEAVAEALYGPIWTANPLPGLASFVASPSAGALWYCPTLLLSAVGWLHWRRQNRLFSAAVLFASLLFTLFLSFLVFFKGEPSWGPRYLTPVFALWWLFVPQALPGIRRPMVIALLALGSLVQLLGLSVDPQRLFLEQGISFTYYNEDPWLGFHPAVSQLWQRPKEIWDILAARDRAPAYTPGPIPTYATTVPSRGSVVVASSVGLLAPLPDLTPLAAGAALPLRAPVLARFHSQMAVRGYHVFASLRPWWSSQRYLAPAERPVDLTFTLMFLIGLGTAGLALMTLANVNWTRRASGLRSGLELVET